MVVHADDVEVSWELDFDGENNGTVYALYLRGHVPLDAAARVFDEWLTDDQIDHRSVTSDDVGHTYVRTVPICAEGVGYEGGYRHAYTNERGRGAAPVTVLTVREVQADPVIAAGPGGGA